MITFKQLIIKQIAEMEVAVSTNAIGASDSQGNGPIETFDPKLFNKILRRKRPK